MKGILKLWAESGTKSTIAESVKRLVHLVGCWKSGKPLAVVYPCRPPRCLLGRRQPIMSRFSGFPQGGRLTRTCRLLGKRQYVTPRGGIICQLLYPFCYPASGVSAAVVQVQCRMPASICKLGHLVIYQRFYWKLLPSYFGASGHQ